MMIRDVNNAKVSELLVAVIRDVHVLSWEIKTPLDSRCPLSLSLSGACHVDGAASMSCCHADLRLSKARRLAVARPKLSRCRSSSTVLNQAHLGLPVLHRQKTPNAVSRGSLTAWRKPACCVITPIY